MAEQPLTVRGAVATVHIALTTLLEAAGVTDTIDIEQVNVNINFAARRIDIAKLTEDGQRIDQWLCGFSIDPRDLPNFGLPVALPTMGRVQ